MSDRVWIKGWPHHRDEVIAVGGSAAYGLGGAHSEPAPYGPEEAHALLCEGLLGWVWSESPEPECWIDHDGKVTTTGCPDFPNDPTACMALLRAMRGRLSCDQSDQAVRIDMLRWEHDDTVPGICTAIRDAGLKALELREAE